VHSGSHDHAKRVYEDTYVDTDGAPEPCAKNDKNVPIAYTRSALQWAGKVSRRMSSTGKSTKAWPSCSLGPKGVHDDANHETDNGPEQSAKYDKAATTAYAVDVAEEDAREREDEGMAFVQPCSHGRAKRVYQDTDDVTDNAPEPSARNEQDTPTAHEVNVAVDMEDVCEAPSWCRPDQTGDMPLFFEGVACQDERVNLVAPAFPVGGPRVDPAGKSPTD